MSVQCEPFRSRRELSQFIRGMNRKSGDLEEDRKQLMEETQSLDDFIAAYSFNDPLAHAGEILPQSVTEDPLFQISVKSNLGYEDYLRNKRRALRETEEELARIRLVAASCMSLNKEEKLLLGELYFNEMPQKEFRMKYSFGGKNLSDLSAAAIDHLMEEYNTRVMQPG